MPGFQPFLLERLMSQWEHAVEFNLSESGVHPIRLGELLGDDPARYDRLLATELNYPQVNGTVELRENIAALYRGASPDHVLVTVGAAEANYLTVNSLFESGDEIVVMLPSYMQVWGVAQNRGLAIREFFLREAHDWAPDLDELGSVVSEKTRAIAVCNPNNPTGRVLTEAEMDSIVRIADRAGAWVLADEVYAGAERTGEAQTPSFFGRYDRVVAIGSLSKAYGLPGLRVGWAVAPPRVVDELWMRHEYTAISTTMLANQLAALALSPEVRPRIVARARGLIRAGYPVLEEWIRAHGDLLSVVPPGAGAIALVRYALDTSSSELVSRLVDERRVLVAPGDHFRADRHLRISFGLPRAYLLGGLERIHELLVALS